MNQFLQSRSMLGSSISSSRLYSTSTDDSTDGATKAPSPLQAFSIRMNDLLAQGEAVQAVDLYEKSTDATIQGSSEAKRLWMRALLMADQQGKINISERIHVETVGASNTDAAANTASATAAFSAFAAGKGQFIPGTSVPPPNSGSSSSNTWWSNWFKSGKKEEKKEEKEQPQGATGSDPKAPLYVAVKSHWSSNVLGIVLMIAPFVLIAFIFFRQNPMSMMNKAYIPVETVNVKFADVCGNQEAKEDLKDIVEYLKDPEKFKQMGIKVPKGVLLVGPPGTGKTLVARALAGEAGVPFISTSGSEFEEMFVGVGARRIRQLFEAARQRAPCIIFIDELDAVGGRRDDAYNRTKMTLNQLLVEMDGFTPSDGVILIGATNFAESLDPALVRAGRFDRKVAIELPDKRARRDILKLYLKERLSKDVNLETLASSTPGFSGADLENMVNWAAIEATKRRLTSISMHLLEEALLNVAMGRERKSLIMDEKTKRLCAYHEAGHALVALHTDGAFKIRKATLTPRGQALGMVSFLPDDAALLTTRRQLVARMDTAMGGRAAEELIFGNDEITQGASNDIDQATQIAKNMVTKLGMSPKVGPVYIKEQEKKFMSPETNHTIEAEVRGLLTQSYARASSVLRDNKDQLHKLAEALLKYETLSVDEIERVLRGELLIEKDFEMQQERERIRLQNEQDTAAQSAVETMKKEVLNRARENAQLPQLPRVAAEAKSADETESAPISVTGK
jgi:ATP-dependent metalloprotease